MSIRRSIQQYDEALKDLSLSSEDQIAILKERGLAYWRLSGSNRFDNLSQAIKSLDAAANLQRFSSNVQLRAEVTQDRAVVLSELVGFEDKKLAIMTAGRAKAAFQSVFDVFTFEKQPDKWAASMFGLAMVHSRWPGSTSRDRDQHIKKTIEYYKRALQVYTEKAYPVEWATTMNNLGNAYRLLSSPDRAANLELGKSHLLQALRVRTRGSNPETWAATTHNLGLVALDLGRYEEAIRDFAQALQVLDEVSYPVQWSISVSALAGAYLKRGGPSHVADVDQAIDFLERALPILEGNHQASEAERARHLLEQALQERRHLNG